MGKLKYNHAFDIAFEVRTDNECYNVKAEEFRKAIKERIDRLTDEELVEACTIYDTAQVEKVYAIARAIEGISLNGKEYALDPLNDEVLLFDSVEQAKSYLYENAQLPIKVINQGLEDGDFLIEEYEE